LQTGNTATGSSRSIATLLATHLPTVQRYVKKADSRNSVILRLYNPDNKQTQATVKLWRPIKEAYFVDFWEERKEKLDLSKGTLKLKIPGKRIVTVEMVAG
jgi:alpha-mannosidase